ncbi:MAG: hypothetical protein Q4B31_00355 [Clostridia bacterium]|nr:hypothetical protein [Clostridia bacterium]
MKHIKKLLSALLLISVLLTAVSCSSSDNQPTNSQSEKDDTASQFVGTWKYSRTDTKNNWTFEETIELKPDGTYHYVDVKNGNLTIREETGEYTIEGTDVCLYLPNTNKTQRRVYNYVDGKLVNLDNVFSKVD